VRRIVRRALLALVVFAGWRCTDAEAASLSPLLRDLARGAGEYRSIAPRLSISRGYTSCRETPPPADGTVTRTLCPAVPAEVASSRAVRRVSAAAGEAGVEPDALHAGALIDVLWGGTGKTLDRAIQSLHTAARLSDRPAPLLADLAAAYLLRAERMQTPGDLDRALEAAEEAMELDSANAAALYNRAIALERIGLADAADDAWRTYLRVDDGSGWADEARAWLRHTVVADVAPPAAPTPASAAEFARRAPQQANAWGWETLLPAWAAARDSGNAAAADSALRLAASVGAALVSARRDATLSDAVAAIRAANAATLVRLARAHRAYGEARRLYEAGDRPAAEPLFARAAAEGAGSTALQMWARLFHAATLTYLKDPRGELVGRQMVAGVDSVRHPALAGRSRWILGTTLSFAGRYEEARTTHLSAAALFARAGEREHRGCAEGLAAEAADKLGDSRGAGEARQRALRHLRPYRASVWHHGVLFTSAVRAHAAGLPRLALHLHGEDLRIAEQLKRPEYMVEARLARARLLSSMGRSEQARQEARLAGTTIEAMPRGDRREWFEYDLRVAQAEIDLRERPDRAVQRIGDAVSFFRQRPSRHLSALLIRAEARLSAGDTAGARADLRDAADVVVRQGAAIRSMPTRGVLFSHAREVFNRLVLTTLASGKPRQALEELERARAVFSSQRGDEPVLAPRVELPAGYAGVEYVLVGDTLLAWTVVGDSVLLARSTIDAAALRRTVERTRSALELRAPEEETRHAMGELYDVLIRPVRNRLGAPDHSLIIVADGPLAGVPFSALYDQGSHQYLVEQRAVRRAASLVGAATSNVSRPAPTHALIVANPLFDRAAYPGYAPLPGAADEASAVAALYPSAHRLDGTNADRAGVTAALAGKEVIHFAGHAVLDDARAEQSFLLLAGRGGEGRMSAGDIGAINLRGTRLVVLSACETARAPDGRADGFTGFSAALIAAGAEGVLGSLWRVDDQLTRALMAEFHRAYRSTGDAPAALRTAQLHLLHSSDLRLRSPAVWAAFIYLGL
jgi:CHAT domain-containing protein